MNVGNLGQRISGLGIQGLRDLSALEAQRRQNEFLMNTKAAQAQGEAIGALAGTLTGAAKGAYQAYEQDKIDEDVARGAQSRKEYGVMTDTTKPIDARVSQVYGPNYGVGVQERNQDVLGDHAAELKPVMEARQASITKNGKRPDRQSLPSMAEMSDVIALEPRVSKTDNLLGGQDATLVSNSPWRDYRAALKYIDHLLTPA